jgi:formylglycine-generating enzyme required for sulfatase activity
VIRRDLVVLLALSIVVGCGKNPPPKEAVEVAALPSIQPPCGGEMVLLPAGTFTMGDNREPNEGHHVVAVTAFYMDKYPVTQEIYEKVMGVNPSKRKAPKNPVERTQWTDAARFCNKCSELEGLTPCYDLTTWQCNFEANGYRLPTEAEWEYACRAGSEGRYCFGDGEQGLVEYGWCKPHSQGKTHPVGEMLPNRWGLYDVHGNVWQWCNDWYAENYYAEGPEKDPRGPAAGKMRVLRGGAWDSTPDKCRSAYRHKEFPTYSDACFGADSYGFRRARKGGTADAGKVVAKGPDTPADPKKPITGTTPVAKGNIDLAKLKGTIVFVSDRSGTLKIWSMHASGKNPRQLTKGDEADADPRFAPDGKRIMYTTLRGGFPEVWMMNRDGSEPKFVTKGSQAGWAPDGKSIVFIRDNQTFVRELGSGEEKLVTPKSWERCGVPAFSPDGKRIALASRHQENIGIYILSLDGKENVPLKAEEACCTPQWSKDGKKLLCQTVAGHIHQVGVDGKNWEQLTFGADVQHDARYSPDGTMILFCRAPEPAGPWKICLKALDGDDEDVVTLIKEGSNLLPDWHGDE